MSTTYPNQIDNGQSLPLVVDNVTEVLAITVNRLRYAVIAVELELGINPKASASDVATRLNAFETSIIELDTAVTNIINDVDIIIGQLDGTQIKLGEPDDGFLPGITTLQDTSMITDTLNTFNNIMSYLAPAQPQSAESLAIDPVSSIPVFSGKIATLTAASPSYYGPYSAGAQITRITKTQAFTITTHDTGDSTTGFSDADKGIIAVLINTQQVATFNLSSAFDEAERANPLGQGVSYSGGTGSATPPLKSLGSYTSPPSGVAGSTEIYSVGLFNNFPLWQKGVVHMVNTTLASGYNKFQIVHTVGSETRTSDLFEVFYDSGASTPTFSTPSLGIAGSPSSFNWLSGVRYLRTGESLTLGSVINNAFVNTYLQTPLSFAFTAAIPTTSGDLSDPSISVTSGNPAAPNTTDQLTIGPRTFAITTLNQQTINQVATITFTNVYGQTFQAQSPLQNILINTYNTPVSTAATESFVDENRRLPSAAYDTIPGSITAQWTSTVALTNGNAQVYNNALVYPTINFTTYTPLTQSVNYSGFNNTNPANGQAYYRAMFSAANPRSTGTITIGGITLPDLTQVSPNVLVEIKLPTQTGWLDMSKPFNSGTFTGIDGDGCRTAASGSSFSWSVGTISTANSGYMYILRITLKNTNRTITSLSESFTA